MAVLNAGLVNGTCTLASTVMNFNVCSVQRKMTDEMLSRRAVTFHYVTPSQMFMFDFLLYHLKIVDLSFNGTVDERRHNQSAHTTA
jgi:hypothetical protein